MLCTLTARKLKPGGFDDFTAAFEKVTETTPPEVLKRWSKVYVTRDVADPDVVLTFGLFDGTLEEFRAIQSGGEGGPPDLVGDLVEEVLLDGSYEVIREITP